MEVSELAKKVDEFHREMRDDMAVLKRGVYGDPKNRIKGLLERQDEDDAWRDKIEARQDKLDNKIWKIGASIGAVFVGFDFAIMYIKGFFK
jgi:hypothetical protein